MHGFLLNHPRSSEEELRACRRCRALAGSLVLVASLRASAGERPRPPTDLDRVGPPGFDLPGRIGPPGVDLPGRIGPPGFDPPDRIGPPGFDLAFRVDDTPPRMGRRQHPRDGPTEIVLRRVTREEVDSVSARSEGGQLRASVEEVEPGTAYKLVIEPTADRSGTASDTITIEAEVGGRILTQIVECVLAVRAKDRIEASPRMVYFRKSDLRDSREKGTPAVKSVDLQALPDPPYRFRVLAAGLDPPGSPFRAKATPVEEGRRYRIEVSLDRLPDGAGDQDGKSVKANLAVLTDDPGLPRIEIRCVAFY